MVKSTDLRIGNYVRDIVSNELMIVDEIGKNIGATLLNNDKYPLPDGWQMGYVPLTPELLVKIGFEQESRNSRTLNYGVLWLRYNGESFEFAIGGDFHAGETHMFRYVHELQNLYRAVTGEELSIEITA